MTRLNRSARTLARLLAGLALLALPVPAFAQAVVTDDAYVTASGHGNFGKAQSLRVSRQDTTYLKFDLSNAVPDGTPVSSVQRAIVQLFVSEVSAAGRLDVSAIQDPWSEGTISVDNAPPASFLVATTDRISEDAQSHFITVDVTPLVRQWLGGPNHLVNNGLVIAARTDGEDAARVVFDSKENFQTGHEPRLFVQLSDVAPAITVTADAPIFVDPRPAGPHLSLALTPGDLPAGSGAYIQNGTAPQAASNFNVSGVGTAGVLNATTQFDLGGDRVLANPGFNLFVGRNTGTANTAGGVTFIGTAAGQANTTGIRNVFVGAEAGLTTDIGGSNTFVGTESGKLNTSGAFNSYFGDLSGVIGTTASGNALFGFRTGEKIVTGSDNAFFGALAGAQTVDGGGNTFVGRDVAIQNTSGNDNTLVGHAADFSEPNAVGAGNTAVGAGARIKADISNATAIGSRAMATRTGVVVLGSIRGFNGSDQDAAVGIGTPNPQEKLDVIGGNIYIGSNGRGLILRSPAGTACRQLSIDDAGNLLLIPVACPAVIIQ